MADGINLDAIKNINDNKKEENKENDDDVDIEGIAKSADISISRKSRARKLKDVSYLKKKKKREKNEIESVMEELNKKKVDSLTGIKNYFESKGTNMDSDIVSFFYELLNSKVFSKRLSINDLLKGRELNIYIGHKRYSNAFNYFTNDKLYWLTLLDIAFKENKYDQDIIKCFKFVDNTVDLETVVSNQESVYKTGYMHDYNADFCFVGEELFGEANMKGIKEGKINPEELAEKEFAYQGKKYKYIYYGKGSLICYEESINLKEALNNIKFVDTKKKFDTNGLKVHKIQNNNSEAIYFSQNIKLTYFMPNIVYLADNAKTSYLFKLNIDMQEYENCIFKIINAKDKVSDDIGEYLYFHNIVEWDTFGTMVDFLIVESHLVLNTNDKFALLKMNIDNLIKDWVDIKEKFNECKQVFTKILNLFVSFYDSFQRKIPYNLDTKYSKIISKIDENLKIVIGNKYDTEVLSFLDKYKLKLTCITIYSCLENDCENVLTIYEMIKSYIESYTSRKEINLINRTRTLGYAIWRNFLYSNATEHLINIIRTPSSFLGNLLGGNLSLIKDKIKQFETNYDEMVERDIKDVELIKQITEISTYSAINVIIMIYFHIRNNEEEKNGNERIKFGYKKRQNKLTGNIARWIKSEKIYTKIKRYSKYKDLVALGRQIIVDNYGYKEYMFDEYKKFLNDLYDGYANYLKKIEANKQMKEAEIKQEAIDINMRNNIGIDPIPDKNIDEKNLNDRKIKIFNTENARLLDFRKYARQNGVTDDIISLWLSNPYSEENLTKENEKDIVNNLSKVTQKLWGKDGSLLKKFNNGEDITDDSYPILDIDGNMNDDENEENKSEDNDIDSEKDEKSSKISSFSKMRRFKRNKIAKPKKQKDEKEEIKEEKEEKE